MIPPRSKLEKLDRALQGLKIYKEEGGNMPDDYPREVLKSIIRKAIEEGKLFELIFSSNGRRLWVNVVKDEEELKRMVRQILRERR